MNVAWFRRLQLSEGVARVLDELHLCQIRAQRLGGGRDGGNRGVSSFLGGVTCFLGGVTGFLGGVARLPSLRDCVRAAARATIEISPEWASSAVGSAHEWHS